LTTEVHLVVDERRLTFTVAPMGSTVNDCTAFPSVLSAIVVLPTGPGRSRCRPDRVIADEAFGRGGRR
jgi:hypothetical protein